MKPSQDPDVPIRIPERFGALLAKTFPADGPTMRLLEGRIVHRTKRSTAFVGWAPRSEVMAAYSEVNDVVMALTIRMAENGTTSAVFRQLLTILGYLAESVGLTEPSLRWRLRRSHHIHAVADARLDSHFGETRTIATLCYMALRGLEEAELMPSKWPTGHGMAAYGGRANNVYGLRTPGFAYLIPPIPVDMLPTQTSDPDEALRMMREALAEVHWLDRIEVVANRVGGPAAAARAWCCDLLATCVIGPDADPASSAEARQLAWQAWNEMAVPSAVNLLIEIGAARLHEWEDVSQWCSAEAEGYERAWTDLDEVREVFGADAS